MRQVGRTQYTLWLALVAVLLAPAAQAQSPSGAEAEMREAVEAHIAGYASNTVEGYFEHYAKDITMWWPGANRMERENYHQSWTKTLADGNHVASAKTGDVQVHMAPSGDAGVASLMWIIERTSGRAYELQTSFTMFKRDGKWEIVHMHFNRPPASE